MDQNIKWEDAEYLPQHSGEVLLAFPSSEGHSFVVGRCDDDGVWYVSSGLNNIMVKVEIAPALWADFNRPK